MNIKLRPCVQRFAEEMEKRLAANDHKGGWEDETEDYLFARIFDEIGELRRALKSKNCGTLKILKEAADVANFVMMIADNSSANSLSGESQCS